MMIEKGDREAFLTGYLEGVKYTSGPVEKGDYIKMGSKRIRLSKLVNSISEMINDRTIEWLTKK